MFNATHKGRVTTLSKAILTAGLLGGAALSTLGAGSAQAAWGPHPGGVECNFGGVGPQCAVNDPSPLVEHKQVTLLDWFSIPDPSVLEFTYQGQTQNPHHVDLDFEFDDTDGGTLTYKIESFKDDFDLVNFISARGANTSLTKTYGTGWNGTDIEGIIDVLSLTTNNADSGPAFGKVLYVKDVWNGPGGIDNLSNEFRQVPAPLPLLGVGAAFGSIRKLRKFSSQLKTFSMG
jgi:hypothetical protein